MASVTVDVDTGDFSDTEIICAARERGYRVIVSKDRMEKFHKWDREQLIKSEIEQYEEATAFEDLAEILSCVKEGRDADAIALIEALMFPKFKTLTECMEKYSKIKAA